MSHPGRFRYPVLLMAGLLLGCRSNDATLGAVPEVSPSLPKPGESLESFTLTDVGGRPLSFSSADGVLEANGTSARPAASVIHVFQPDCGACREEARALEAWRREGDAVAIVGIAHRGGLDAVEAFRRDVGVGYPLAAATGTEWARKWGRGDPTYIVDREGRLAYVQTGFEARDPRLWHGVAADLAAGRAARVTGSGRDVLEPGETLPTIELPSLEDGGPLSLSAESGRLVFRDGKGREMLCSASIGFFSRY